MPTVIPNDHIGPGFAELVPEPLRGSDAYVDIVTWNIWYFHERDPDRVDTVVDVLEGLNADIIVLQEIREGALDVVAQKLSERGAGNYDVAYGATGGQQRVAMMYDLDWIRAKDDLVELFGKGEVIGAASGKDAFPRLPLWGYFTALPVTENEDPFDFQLVGLHLKSKRGGGDDQRLAAGNALAYWMENNASRTDADVIMMGDWNNTPGADDWAALRDMEGRGEMLFTQVNDPSDFSYLYYRNKSNLGTRIDLAAISVASADELVSSPDAVRWIGLDDFLEGNPKASEIKDDFARLKRGVSDHLPVVTRFTFAQSDDVAPLMA